MIKMAVFYPTQIMNFNPFDNAERKVYEYLSNNYGFDITIFVDKKNNYKYSGTFLKIRDLRPILSFLSLPVKAFNRGIAHCIPYPIYPELIANRELAKFDLVLTENPWYALSLYPYIQTKKYILVDSETTYRRVNGLIRKIVGRACGILALTPLVKAKYYKLGLISDKNERIKIIGGHPIDIEVFQRSEYYPDDKIINVVSTGRLVYEKGFQIILKVIKEVVRKYPNIFLHLIGDGSYRNKIEKTITKAKLRQNVKIYGKLGVNEIAEIYKNSHIFLSHPLETNRWQEFFGVANLEAMSSGLPVITSNSGAIPYVTKDNAIIIEQNDVDGLIKVLIKLITDKEYRINLGMKGYAYVREQYGVDKIAKNYYSAIMDLLHDKNWNN